MLKIALCLSGQVRTFERCFASQKHFILDTYKPDVFIHAWHDESLEGEQQDIQLNNNSKPIFFQQGLRQKLQELYKPLSMVLQAPMHFPIPDNVNINAINASMTDPRYYNNRVSMMRSVYEAGKLKEDHEEDKNFKYDYVIRSRFDIQFNSSVPLPQEDFYVICARGAGVQEVDDKFAIAYNEKMNHYNKLYDHHESYINEGVPPCPHYLLTRHLHNEKVAKLPRHTITLVR